MRDAPQPRPPGRAASLAVDNSLDEAWRVWRGGGGVFCVVCTSACVRRCRAFGRCTGCAERLSGLQHRFDGVDHGLVVGLGAAAKALDDLALPVEYVLGKVPPGCLALLPQ